jgi:hypothetical protein
LAIVFLLEAAFIAATAATVERLAVPLRVRE